MGLQKKVTTREGRKMAPNVAHYFNVYLDQINGTAL
jgi:hypothetical protein